MAAEIAAVPPCPDDGPPPAAAEGPAMAAEIVALLLGPDDGPQPAAAGGPAAAAEIAPMPYGPDDDIASGVKCHRCDSFTATSWMSLANHLRRMHQVKNCQVAGTFLHTKLGDERRKNDREAYKKKAEEKQTKVKTEPVDRTSGPYSDTQLKKDPAVRLSEGEVKRGGDPSTYWRAKWVLCKDGSPVSPPVFDDIDHFDLTNLQLAPPGGSAAVAAASAPAAQVEPPPQGPAASAANAVFGQLALITEKLNQLAKPKDLEVNVVAVKVDDFANTWEPGDEAKVRNTFPKKWTGTVKVNLDGFAQYLAMSKNHDTKTQKTYVLAITRLLHIAMPDVATDVISYLVSLQKIGLMTALTRTKLLDLRFGWSRQLATAMVHFVNFAIQEAIEKDFVKAKWHLEMLMTRVVQPWHVRSLEAKRLSSFAKAEVDGLRLEGLPPVDACRLAVHQAMCDLAILARNAANAGTTTVQEKYMANIALAQIIIYGTYTGRSGPV